MAIASKIETTMANASWIRRMFEEGVRLKREFGDENVFDFTLGNPILEPPEVVKRSLERHLQSPGIHRYMPNAGHPDVRRRIAEHLSAEHGEAFAGEDIIMTCGAAGGLNVALKSLLEPGDEVVVIAPFFPEYRFYVDNHCGKLVIAESAADFDLDLGAIDRAVGSRTKVVIINSPNNPTGRMYSADRLRELGALLAEKERQNGGPITLLSDEPYRKIVFDGLKAPSAFGGHPNTILILSHSKDLGLAGERIGYAAISPRHADRQKLSEAMTFVNRTLGFVNAPALFQRVVAETQAASVPVQVYQELRDRFCDGLERAGIEHLRPQGAFYLFPKTPIPDDVEFVRRLVAERVLAVPGTGFGRPGHMRICFCVTMREVEASLPLIARAARDAAA